MAHLGARPAAGLSGVHQQTKFAAGQALVAAALGIAHHIFSVEPTSNGAISVAARAVRH